MSRPSTPSDLREQNAELRQTNEDLRERLRAIEETLEERASVHWGDVEGNPSELRIEAPENRSRGQQAVYPYRMLGSLRDDVDELFERVAALERHEVDPADLIAGAEETQLPIERVVAAVRNGLDDYSANERRAAYVFEAFGRRARPVPNQLALDSHDVRTILEEDADVETPNANTVRRVMTQTAKLTSRAPREERVARRENGADERNLLWLETRQNRLQLRADKEEWSAYLNGVTERAHTPS